MKFTPRPAPPELFDHSHVANVSYLNRYMPSGEVSLFLPGATLPSPDTSVPSGVLSGCAHGTYQVPGFLVWRLGGEHWTLVHVLFKGTSWAPQTGQVTFEMHIIGRQEGQGAQTKGEMRCWIP